MSLLYFFTQCLINSCLISYLPVLGGVFTFLKPLQKISECLGPLYISHICHSKCKCFISEEELPLPFATFVSIESIQDRNWMVLFGSQMYCLIDMYLIVSMFCITFFHFRFTTISNPCGPMMGRTLVHVQGIRSPIQTAVAVHQKRGKHLTTAITGK